LVKVDIAGQRYFNTDQLRERMFLQEKGFIRLRHGRYSDGFVRRDEAAIVALYKDNGFRDAKVTTTTVDDYQGKKGNVAVTMKIEEGPQYRVRKVDLTGVTDIATDKFVQRLSSEP